MSELLAEALVKIYRDRRVVDGVTIRVRGGEVVGLLGRNGAGKSTTFQMIAGLVTPDGGDVRLDGVSLARRSLPQRARLGLTYLPQERSVFLKLSALDNLLVPLEERGVGRRERLARARALLEEFGLLASAHLKGYALSGGEARKLEVARALTVEPRFILLDEPFAGMDPLHVRELQSIIRALGERGIGVLLSDHNVFYAFEVIERGYIIDAGRVLVEGPPTALAVDPRARAAFLGEEFRLPPRLRGAVPRPTGAATSP
jgi:lipopolysaccharide export system ATP-binding protein